MKHRWSSGMWLGLLAATIATAQTGQNLLTNGDFEASATELTGWRVSSGNAVYSASSDNPYAGLYCAHGVEAQTGSLGRLYQDVTDRVTPGQRYRIAGALRTQDAVGDVVIGLDRVGPGGWTLGGGYIMEIGHRNGTTGWQSFQSNWFVLPPLVGGNVAYWFLIDFNNGRGHVWIDDLVLEPERPATYMLTITATVGGSVVMPGEGEFSFPIGQLVPIEATPVSSAYEFLYWAGSAVTVDRRGRVADRFAPKTTVLVDGDYTLQAVFAERADGPSLGVSLGELEVDDPLEFAYRVSTNNVEGMSFVERVTGAMPDPNGMMRMHVLGGEPARAKGRFGKCSAERVLVRFEYLFESSEPAELIVYLSNVPGLLDRGDRSRSEHYVEIGRVPMPARGRAGSLRSARFGIFEEWVSTGGLDLGQGTWVELELTGGASRAGAGLVLQEGIQLAAAPGTGAASIGSLAVWIICSGICMDLNWSDTADEEDFLLAIAAVGHGPDLSEADRATLYCLEGAWTDDGYMDGYDVHSLDWSACDETRVGFQNLCRVPPVLGAGGVAATGAGHSMAGSGLAAAGLGSWPGELLVVGKTRRSQSPADLFADGFYLFDTKPSYLVTYTAMDLPDRCNIRVVRGPAGEVYLVNSERGVLRLGDTIEEIIPPGSVRDVNEPRFDGLATVYIGMQGQGASTFGRPIFDVAFDRYGYAYIAPVVVESGDGTAYVAAAKLELRKGSNPPYRVVRLYDDPPPTGDNQHRDYVREVEVDDANNLYLVNVHSRNESCILWKYSPDGELLRRRDLTRPDSPVQVEDPLALHLARDGQTLHLASGQYQRADANNAVIYALSTTDFSLARSLTVRGMQLVTSIAEDANSLWIVGFSMPQIPKVPSPLAEPFYRPYIARIPAGADTADALAIADPSAHNLALPTSIVWTASP